jgi:hypothetical protein
MKFDHPGKAPVTASLRSPRATSGKARGLLLVGAQQLFELGAHLPLDRADGGPFGEATAARTGGRAAVEGEIGSARAQHAYRRGRRGGRRLRLRSDGR